MCKCGVIGTAINGSYTWPWREFIGEQRRLAGGCWTARKDRASSSPQLTARSRQRSGFYWFALDRFVQRPEWQINTVWYSLWCAAYVMKSAFPAYSPVSTDCWLKGGASLPTQTFVVILFVSQNVIIERIISNRAVKVLCRSTTMVCMYSKMIQLKYSLNL